MIFHDFYTCSENTGFSTEYLHSDDTYKFKETCSLLQRSVLFEGVHFEESTIISTLDMGRELVEVCNYTFVSMYKTFKKIFLKVFYMSSRMFKFVALL